MKIRYSVHIFAIFLLFHLACADNKSPQNQTHTHDTIILSHDTTVIVPLGNTQVNLVIKNYKNPDTLIFISLHDDENTAVQAMDSILQTSNYCFVQIAAQGTREIAFTLNNKIYKFDPNRMFTSEGLKKNLKNYGNYSQEAEMEIEKLKNSILTLIKPYKTVIALHNNRIGYDITYYRKTGKFAADAENIYENTQLSPHDFFFVTDTNVFTDLKAKNQNVVLQRLSNLPDDGSLSVYCSKNQQNYINIEAFNNHKNEQYNMILKVLDKE